MQKRDAATIGMGRELALLLLCHLDNADPGARAEALDLAIESPASDEGALAQIEALRSDSEARRFARKQVGIIVEQWAVLDELIEATSDRWRLARMAQVDRCLLRLAASELRADSTPLGVVSSECVRLAAKYGDESSPRFVNGLVSALAERVRG